MTSLDGKTWRASAPANIALIKYMGKKDDQRRLPLNPSISYTLPHLTSTVQLSLSTTASDTWQPLSNETYPPLALSINAQQRFLQHLQFLKAQFQITQSFLVQSENNFPHSAGIASSASSFAALTQCALQAFSELTQQPLPTRQYQAQLSRHGSGSSCRSFYTPWCIWDNEHIEPIETAYPILEHRMLLGSTVPKTVSSSEAHHRVKTSPYYHTRATRAHSRFHAVREALVRAEWSQLFHLCWTEFMDMHQLFETAHDPFSYRTPKVDAVLAVLREHWETAQDGPLITMDAGATIHLLYRPDQRSLAQTLQHTIEAI